MNNDSPRFCPECEHKSTRRVEHREETHRVRGETIVVAADVAVCNHCNRVVADLDLDSQTIGSIYDEYRRRHGMIGPQHVKTLRERYGLSQRGLSRLLGWEDGVIRRYENGALADAEHDTLLQSLQDDQAMYHFTEEHQDRLSPWERHRARQALVQQIRDTGLAEIRNGLELIMNAHAPLERGFKEFDLERLGQMVVYFTT